MIQIELGLLSIQPLLRMNCLECTLCRLMLKVQDLGSSFKEVARWWWQVLFIEFLWCAGHPAWYLMCIISFNSYHHAMGQGLWSLLYRWACAAVTVVDLPRLYTTSKCPNQDMNSADFKALCNLLHHVLEHRMIVLVKVEQSHSLWHLRNVEMSSRESHATWVWILTLLAI